MPVAIELNKRIAGKPVPFTMKPAYTGCPVGCGEPLVNDIGIMKVKDGYSLYAGGKSKGQDAAVGSLLFEELTPDELYQKVDRLLEIYSEHGKKREQMHKFINRFGKDTLINQLN